MLNSRDSGNLDESVGYGGSGESGGSDGSGESDESGNSGDLGEFGRYGRSGESGGCGVLDRPGESGDSDDTGDFGNSVVGDCGGIFWHPNMATFAKSAQVGASKKGTSSAGTKNPRPLL